MALANGIKSALTKYGAHITIIRDSGLISGEYTDFEPNSQVTKPFIREHFVEGTVPFDSDIEAGDVLRDDLQQHFLVMNFTPEVVRNEHISNEAVYYKCNVSGELSRVSGEVRDLTSYKITTVYDILETDCYGVLVDTSVGVDILQEDPIGQIETTSHFLFLPHSVGIRSLDRYTPHLGEHYKVESVEEFRFPAVDVCKLSEDTLE